MARLEVGDFAWHYPDLLACPFHVRYRWQPGHQRKSPKGQDRPRALIPLWRNGTAVGQRSTGPARRWYSQVKLRSVGIVCLELLLAAPSWAQEPFGLEPCPHDKGWTPGKEELQQVLSDHMTWLNKDAIERRRNFKGRANLCNANLRGAQLNYADLRGAQLNNADLRGAQLNNASLVLAQLNNADLNLTQLKYANLIAAQLNNADLTGAELKDAKIAYLDLTGAAYAPMSAPPDSYVAGIKGLSSVTFLNGHEIGLVQLRDLLQKAGLRDLEREATFAIERGKTKDSLDDWEENPAGAIEGVFRYVAFDLTTAYGLRPGRSLLLIVILWALLIPIYAWPIWRSKRPPTASGIYRIWPRDRVEVREDQPTLDNSARVERVNGPALAAVWWASYFSLLSTFQIGFREFSVGTWLTRTQPRNFALESTGWIRTVSGIQSLLSVYLLAIWLLTYFGRPFQ
jgi:hypothetical protein